MHIPRVVIAGTTSGSGKTTVTMALMKSLMKRKFQVQGFKVGPDYIDPGFHTFITGRASRNLDTWMMTSNTMKEIFQRGSKNSDISVIEGVMGLYDGQSGNTDKASTAEIAKKLTAPVILVVNAESQARSVAAVVHGFKTFDEDVNVCGVILNKVSSKGHYDYLREAIKNMEGIEILGYIPKETGIEIPERHLGLTPVDESEELNSKIDRLSEVFNETVSLDKIIHIADKYQNWSKVKQVFFNKSNFKKIAKVAIANDKVFSFYYQDNLDWLQERGVEWVPISPLKDKELPKNVSGVYLGGGFPEMFARELSQNRKFMDSLIDFYKKGKPILAECGGFIYLTRSLTDLQGNNYPMSGIIPGKIHMKSKLVALGYREAKALNDSFLLSKGETIRGHEFRYSEFIPDNEAEEYPLAYELKGRRNTLKGGYVLNNLVASYLHIHLASNPCAGYKWLDILHQS
ncbi:cobyrinate a,c-diamide synthase [Natranaerobius trueperi]|uniref:Cobyrinate a,c-diamide synthase n=1 Tax=Natranaerobius trueperi TaxID=759412 RepID=A0A226BW31_9FIRM|nr:cobyrinate a,c-diamide synthase [Natranaerobius trueperi]OWZ82982.1 cobyrinic acid a,c-diamide synthase [Natranaerobius trueperi]